MAQAPARGLFVPTTNIWDMSRIADLPLDINTKELLVRMYQNIANISNALNLKDSGYYDTNQFITGQNFFPNPANSSQTNPYKVPAYRPTTRVVINFGALPNSSSKSVPHNITVTDQVSWTRIYATATDPVGLTGIPIPNLEVSIIVNSTNVTITTTTNYSNYTICYCIVEWLIN